MTGNQKLMFIASIVICNAAGVIGSFFTRPAIREWYIHIKKPAFTPPNWVFAPVWITLFILMGVSLYLVWSAETPLLLKKTALAVFAVHLLLNIGWSFFFFYLRSPLAGLADIIILWLFIIAMLVLFHRVRPLAMVLQIPYFLWVSFAACLNWSIWRLNPAI